MNSPESFDVSTHSLGAELGHAFMANAIPGESSIHISISGPLHKKGKPVRADMGGRTPVGFCESQRLLQDKAATPKCGVIHRVKLCDFCSKNGILQ